MMSTGSRRMPIYKYSMSSGRRNSVGLGRATQKRAFKFKVFSLFTVAALDKDLLLTMVYPLSLAIAQDITANDDLPRLKHLQKSHTTHSSSLKTQY
jgi:hypothetical protein